MNDLVAFWSQMLDGETVHPADAFVFEQLGGQHEFDLSCLPCSFCGDIQSAPVVLLYLSPGLSPPDHEIAQSAEGRARYRAIRLGQGLLPTEDEHRVAWRWWTSRTKCFGHWEALRPHLALLNIGGYHSRNFTDWQTLASLPSSRQSLNWAQSELFPQAIEGRRVVVCLRAARFWGLSEGRHGKALFAPPTTRGGHMRLGALRDEVIGAVRAILAGQRVT